MMFRLSFLVASLTMMAAAGAATAVANEEARENSAAAGGGGATLHFLAPHPLAGLEATPEDVATTMLGHYGKPPTECEGDEKAFQISGVPGMVRRCGFAPLFHAPAVVWRCKVFAILCSSL